MRTYTTIVCIALLGTLWAQNRNLNWVIGQDVWLKFYGDTLSWEQSSYEPSVRNACLSDVEGNLIILADDQGVHDALFELMPGGDSLGLDWTTPSGNYLVLPKPGAEDRFVIVRCEAGGYHRAGWVEVDMQANAGLGAVVGLTHWFAEGITARLAATPHPNGVDYWVMLHEDATDAFLAYLLTADGMEAIPTISHVGGALLAGVPASHVDRRGAMKFSVQGDKLAIARSNGTVPDTALIQLFWFNDTNGELAFWTDLMMTVWRYDSPPFWDYMPITTIGGLDFDPSGEYLYVAGLGLGDDPYFDNRFFQFGLADTAAAAIAYSGVYLGGSGNLSSDSVQYDPTGSSMQLAPNGLIYGRRPNSDNFEVTPALYWLVNLPAESPVTSPPLNGTGQTLWGTTHILGFPTFCKVYHDSDPGWSGIEPIMSSLGSITVRPNPMDAKAALMLPQGTRADRIQWFDALGRLVLSKPVHTDGPTFWIEREGLPAGLFLLRVLEGQRLVGSGRVILD